MHCFLNQFFYMQTSPTVLHMLHHCKLHHIWLQSKLCMGGVFTTAVGIAGWSVGIIKDVHFRGSYARVHLPLLLLLLMSL